MQRVQIKKRNRREQASEDQLEESAQKRLQKLEFDTFKNCSVDYKWKANVDDIGLPDDITTP
ncbi:MAG: hypothetical protein IT287_08375 [Bdellovibrionaceae bacterium]|nr:hypothetical protein [Pseudobdellovibrionaceae bacterium]